MSFPWVNQLNDDVRATLFASLGVEPDRVIGPRYGVSRTSVYMLRVALGIGRWSRYAPLESPCEACGRFYLRRPDGGVRGHRCPGAPPAE